MNDAKVIDLFTPDEAVRAAVREAIMQDFEVDAPLNRFSDLVTTTHKMAGDNAEYLGTLPPEHQHFEAAQRLDGFFADIYFILTKCEIVLPDGVEWRS